MIPELYFVNCDFLFLDTIQKEKLQEVLVDHTLLNWHTGCQLSLATDITDYNSWDIDRVKVNIILG